MDETTEKIADFTFGITAEMFSEKVLHEVKRRLVDSMGCMVGGMSSVPAGIARGLAADVTGRLAATAIGLPTPTTVELAAFTNTVATRYLDYNDMYFAPKGGGGHPSDVISTALAMGEALGSSGRDVILAIVVGYEVLGNLAGTVRLRERGWDQGLYTVVATAMMAGKLLGCTQEQLANAVSLGITPHVPTRQTRVGELAMWKGCATAGAAQNGIFAALLASRGLTGPPMAFEGADGIWDQVTGPFELDLPLQPESYVIERIHTKFRPAEYNSQGVLDIGHELHDVVKVDEIESIDVDTYWLAYSEIGSEPAKWDPQTRETADHSIPYLLAVALVDGDVGLNSFTRERILDPALRPVMNKIKVTENADFTSRFPAELLARITIKTTGGEAIVREVAHPRGHTMNPLSDDEIDHKFDGLVEQRPDGDVAVLKTLRAKLWELDTIADIAPVLKPLGSLHVG